MNGKIKASGFLRVLFYSTLGIAITLALSKHIELGLAFYGVTFILFMAIWSAQYYEKYGEGATPAPEDAK